MSVIIDDAIACTPLREVFALYGVSAAVEMDAWEPSNLDIAQQCAYLHPQRIADKAQRNKLINALCTKEQGLQDLQKQTGNVYLRIHIKYALKLYSRDSTLTDCAKDHEKEEIKQWSYQQLFSSFLAFLIENGDQGLDKNHLTKVWQFAGYLRQYFKENNYGGDRLVEFYSQAGNKGWGLAIWKMTAQRFKLKGGLYTKAKKLCTQWSRKVFEIAPKPDPDAEFQPKEPTQYIPNKFVTYIPQKLTPREVLWGKKWLWLNDEAGGQMQWRPYRPEDVKKLNKAWVKQEARVFIVEGGYRVDFDRTNDQSPAGFQFNNHQANPGSRQVICAEWYQDSKDVYGLPVAAEPL